MKTPVVPHEMVMFSNTDDNVEARCRPIVPPNIAMLFVLEEMTWNGQSSP